MQDSLFKYPVYNSLQFAEWDRFTIRHKYTSGWELMEESCTVFTRWFVQKFPDRTIPLVFLCGKGNNGGDALGIARMLAHEGYERLDIRYITAEQNQCSAEFIKNWHMLPHMDAISRNKLENVALSGHTANAILIDGLLGTGVRFPLQESFQQIVYHVNQAKFFKILSIDLPSGLDPDRLQHSTDLIHADYTFTFQQMKRSFLFEENGKYCGQVYIGDIGLAKNFCPEIKSTEYFIEQASIRSLIRQPDRFTHKHKRGSVCVLCGSLQYPGAAILVSRSAYRAGIGLVYVLDNIGLKSLLLCTTPEVIPITYESFMQKVGSGEYGSTFIIGSGLSKTAQSIELVKWVCSNADKAGIVFDADALNIIVEYKLDIPPKAIITPHVGEFDRIFGHHDNAFDRLETAKKMAVKLGIIIVLKGPYTRVINTDGLVFFNTTGNSGLSKAGTGDVLAGIIGSLLGQGYSPINAAIISVYIHGLAGDAAIRSGINPISLMASDVIDFISESYNCVTVLDTNT